ncbi:hypothetical protein [Ruminococcus sp.]|nr:hypothetical protein [Ruminococcus sp.]
MIENIFKKWVRHNGEPILFSKERGALEYMHGMEIKTQGAFTEFEVREVI